MREPKWTPENVPVYVNPDRYKDSPIHRKVEFKVVAILDAVPGAFYEPRDHMAFIGDLHYVQSVEFVREIIEEETRK
jgi:hypothetical protein